MTQPITKLASLIVMIAATAFASNANADEYSHIDRLAVKIRNNARRITRETVHYRHSPEYAHMIADSKDLYALASHIHDVTHFEGNLNHLIIDLKKLDRAFHHLESVFDRVEHDAAHGHGHVHGNTAHVKRLLNSIEDDIHHIQEDVDNLRPRPIIVRPPVCEKVTYPVRRPYGGYGHGRSRGYGGHGSYGHGRSGFGLSIGGGSSRIQFNF